MKSYTVVFSMVLNSGFPSPRLEEPDLSWGSAEEMDLSFSVKKCNRLGWNLKKTENSDIDRFLM